MSEAPAPSPSGGIAAHDAAAVSVRVATDQDRESWDRYVATAAAGSFYHRFAWRNILKQELGLEPIYLVAMAEGRIVGVLPLVLLASRLFGRILCSMPFLNYGGPCVDSEAASKALIDEAVRRSDALGADYLELRCAHPAPTDLPVSTHKVSMTIALEADPDVLWNNFKTKHRNNLRRAIKNDLTAKSGGIELLDDFYAILERSWRDLGTPLYRKDFFAAVMREFAEETRIHLCLHRERPVAGAFNGLHAGVVEGMWAGGLPESRDLQANYVLYWHMIQDGCRQGSRLFHLGRSTADSGGEWFKTRWNAEAQQLYWYFHRPRGGPMPELNVNNPKYRLAIATWRRLPLPVVRYLGPRIARCIP